MLCKSQDRQSLNSPLACIQLTYIKSIDMLNKNTPGKKNQAKSKVPVSSYSYTRLKSVISGRGQGPSCLLGIKKDQLHKNSRMFNLSQYMCNRLSIISLSLGHLFESN